MNYDRWKHLMDFNTPPDCMDWRHVKMINAALVESKCSTVAAIGIARGFSTASIIEAIEDPKTSIKEVDLIDPYESPHLISMFNGLGKCLDSVHLRFNAMPSHQFQRRAEFWLIDGDHQGGASLDYEKAIASDAKVIVVHDSNDPSPAGPQNWGAVAIAKRLRKDATECFEDCIKRDGEMTDRGLLIGFFYPPTPETMIALTELSL